MRFGKIMLAVGIVATLGFLAAGAQGYAEVDRGTQGPILTTHVVLGLVAVLLFVLAHGWVLIYLMGIGRVLAREAGEAGQEEELEPSLRSFPRTVLPPLLAALSGIAVFVLGSAVYSGRVPGSVHGAALWLTVALQAWAVFAEGRALAASERALEALRR